MSSSRLSARVDGSRPHAQGRLHDFDLVFDKPGKDGTGKANVRPQPGARVHGVVWEIDRLALTTLDHFEPGYTRRGLEIVIENRSPVVAWTYVYSGVATAAGPSDEYLRHLVEGAVEHALPEHLVTRLEAQRGTF
jgi:gamma-glutamylcyclotransferase